MNEDLAARNDTQIHHEIIIETKETPGRNEAEIWKAMLAPEILKLITQTLDQEIASKVTVSENKSTEEDLETDMKEWTENDQERIIKESDPLTDMTEVA